MGLEMYRLDTAAWVATDALLQAISRIASGRSGAGWIVRRSMTD